MILKFLKWHLLRGPLMRRVVLRAFMLMLALIVLCVMQMGRDIRVIGPITSNIDDCPFDLGPNPEFGASPFSCKESENFTKIVFKVLMEKHLLQSNARSLCVGLNSASAVLALRHLGFFNVFSVDKHPFFSLLERRFVYELDFEDNHFDFVFIDDLDRVSVPSLLVLEIERVLHPGGTGAILVGPTPASSFLKSFLKSSKLVHQCRIGSFTLVVFKKRLEAFASFEHFRLPSSCPSFERNKPYMKYIEPLSNKISSKIDRQLSYLPNYMNITSRNKLIYINLGAGEYAKTSVAKMSKHYCSNYHPSFEVFVIDYKTSVLSSYVTDPGINFVYHPGLSGDTASTDITSDEFLSAPMDDEGFDFVRWFKETVSDGDFVVLMTKAKLAELNILVEMFKTGAVCHVDELYLGCDEDCVNLLESLRKSGVYVHQWLGD